MDLDRPVPTVPAEVDFTQRKASGKYICSVCGYVYDPAEHDGVAFEDQPDDWKAQLLHQRGFYRRPGNWQAGYVHYHDGFLFAPV